ncbi:hypothetical protein AMECASPLE_020342 [Ameca splendens]|uniref:Uncharacterized protein n=1 Tax=Ameca splendens TaxID=208324 RepID=A0ABV0ZC27_9TELE
MLFCLNPKGLYDTYFKPPVLSLQNINILIFKTVMVLLQVAVMSLSVCWQTGRFTHHEEEEEEQSLHISSA